MNKKIISLITIALLIILAVIPTVYAANEDTTLEKAEDNVCKIKLGEDGELTKKLIDVSNEKKEVTLQVDVTNLRKEEESVRPSEIFLVIDNSDSMAQNRLESGVTRKEAVFTAAKQLAEDIIKAQSSTKIGIVSFSSSSEPTKEGILEEDAKLVLKATNNISQIKSAIDGIEAVGPRTDIDAGLQIASNNFTKNSTLNQYLILLTDGVPNTAVGGPTMTYSGAVTTKTKATLKSVVDKRINIITVMTGVDSTRQPDPTGAIEPTAAGKTYQQLAEEIFGTQENPTYGKFYYVSDSDVEKTMTKDVFSDVVVKVVTEIKNITVVDYFPDDIIANYDYEIVEEANIGTVSAKVDTTNNSITWTIEKLKAGETASFKYKLKLKEKYDEKILNVVMPTNKKVDVTYTGTDNTEHKETSDVSPKIVLKKEKKQEVPEEDPTVAPDPIPQTGEKIIFIAAAIIVIFATAVVNLIKTRKIK